MALTVTEQALFDFAKASVPGWLFAQLREEELINAFVKIFDAARTDQIDAFDSTFILKAKGIFLDQHAKDRGTSRQEGEFDPLLRQRIRQVEDAVSRPAILAAAQAIVDEAGIIGTVEMVEVRRDRAFMGDFVSDAGTGGTFEGLNTNGEMFFRPDGDFAGPPFTQIAPDYKWRIALSGAATAANDGTFAITGLKDNFAKYDNPIGMAEVDPGVSWVVEKLDQDGNLADTFKAAYLSRGYRMGSQTHSFILILPFGCNVATTAAILEMLRQKKAAGVLGLVECRTSP